MSADARAWTWKVVALVLVGALGLIFALLHTQPVKQRARAFLVQTLSSALDGRVELGNLDYRLWKGEVLLRDLRLESTETRPHLRIRVDALRIGWRPLAAFGVRAERPVVTLEDAPGPDDETETTAGGRVLEPQLPEWLEKVEIVEGKVRWQPESGENRVILGPLDLEIAPSGAGFEGTLAVKGGKARWGSRRIDIRKIAAATRGLEGDLWVEESTVQTSWGTAEAEGHIETLRPFGGELFVDFRLDAANLAPSEDGDLEGALEGAVRVRAAEGDLRAEGDLDAEDLRWKEIGPLRGRAAWTLSREKFRISSMELSGDGARLDLTAELDLEESTQRFDVRFQGVRLKSFMNHVGWEPIGNTTLQGTASGGLSHWDPDTFTGNAEVFVGGGPSSDGALKGRIVVTAAAGDATLNTEGLSFPGGRVQLDAKLEDLERLSASYRLDLEELSRAWTFLREPPPFLLEGGLVVEGEARGELGAWKTFSATARLDGDNLRLGGESFALDGEVHYRDAALQIPGLSLRGSSGGAAHIEGVVPFQRRELFLQARFEGFPLDPMASLSEVPLEGAATGDIAARGNWTRPDLTASLQLSPLRYREREGRGRVELRVEGRVVRVDELALQLGDASLSAEGQFDLDDQILQAAIDGASLPLSLFPLPSSMEKLEATIARLEIRAEGRVPALSGSARLDLENVAFKGVELPPLELGARADGRRAQLEVRFPPSDGAVAVTGEVTLEEPYPSRLDAELGALPWDRILAAAGARPDSATQLALEGRARVAVPLTELSEFRASGHVESATLDYRELTIRVPSTVRWQVDRERVEISGFRLTAEDTEISIEGDVALREEVESELRIEGDAALALGEPFLGRGELDGTVHLDLRLTGGLDDPHTEGAIEIEGAGYRDESVLVEDVGGRIEASGSRLIVPSLEGRALGGTLTIRGSIPMPRAREPAAEASALTFEVRDADFARLLPGSDSLKTVFAASGEIRFPQGGFEELNTSGEIRVLRIEDGTEAVRLRSPVRWKYADGRLRFDTLHLEGGRTNLSLDGELVTSGPETSATLSVQGAVDASLANAMLPESLFVDGVVELEAEAKRSGENWDLSGAGRLSGMELYVEEPSLFISNIEGRLRFEQGAFHIEDLTAAAGGGSLRGAGTLQLPGSEVVEDSMEFQLDAEGVRLEYPDGLRSEISASLSFRPQDGRYRLEGHVQLEQAVYTKNISPERELIEALRRETMELAAEPGFTDRVQLELDVGTERDIVVNNNLGEIRASADLLITGTIAVPEVSGTIRARPGSNLELGENRYEIESALVELTAYPSEPPRIDLRARTQTGGHDVVFEASGRTDNLRTNLYSPTDPTLSRADVASLLLTGRTVEQTRGEEGQIVGEQAAAYLGSNLAGLTELGLGEALPVTRVSVEPNLVGRETDPGARFSLGQAVTEDLFLTYSIGLNDAEKRLWIVDYDMPRRLKLRAIREDGNEYTGALSQELLFDIYERPRPIYVPEDTGPKVRQVEIRGEPTSRAHLRDLLEMDSGDTYDYWRAREDAGRIRKALREEGYLTTLVQVETRPSDVEKASSVSVIYEVSPGPVVRTVWTGDDPGEALKRRIRGLWDGYLPVPVQASRLAQDATRQLQTQRHYQARVDAEAQELDGTVEVVFDVELGPRGQRVAVIFEGNRQLEDEELERLLPDTSSPEFFELVLDDTEELRERIGLLYATRGYLTSRVQDVSTRFATAKREFQVQIEIEEGERARVDSLVLIGADHYPEERLQSLLRLREGEAFRMDTYLRDRRELASFYRREGFPDVNVRSRLGRDGEGLVVTYRVEEGQRARVGSIEIEGARATDESVIRRAVTFETGDPLKLSDFASTQGRLYDLQIFRSVDVRTTPVGGAGGLHDVVIEVSELPDVRLSYGARYSTEDRFEVTGDIEFPNVLGSARHFLFSTFVGTRARVFRGNVHMPYFAGIELDTDLFVSRETETTESFDSRAWAFTFQQSHPLTETLQTQWSYSYRLSDVIGKVGTSPFAFDVQAARSILSASLIEDTRNSLTRPTKGRFWNATAQFAPDFLGSDIRFAKLFAQLFLYRSIGERLVWASSYRVGIANAFGQVLLPEDRFRAGGPSSVRGFPVNELGELDPRLGEAVGGEGVVIFNQELRFPIFWRFGGVAFYDAGNIFLEGSDFDLFDLRHSVGTGLRVDLPVGLLSADWARVLNPPTGLSSSRFHFSFGHAF